MLIYIIGIAMGILSGLALGGGTLLVPALVIFLKTPQHIAQGICLTVFIPTALIAVITHFKQGNVKLSLTLYLALGSLIGAFLGAILANQLPAPLLKKIFGSFLLLMGLYTFFSK
ncbi:MAG TPA: sulfite exporter TauE/SafE family protein [Clostridia bacterium]|nr:sulfite exporter TauE/SafE family protein [Clostridia bacterium]